MIRQHIFAPILCGLVLIAGTAAAVEQQPTKSGGKAPEVAVEETQTGQTREAKYAGLLESLKTEITKQLPAIDQAKVAAWLAAIKAEEGPAKDASAKAGAVANMKAAEGNLRQLEENLKAGPKTLADAKDDLQRAKAKGEENPEKEKVLASAEQFLAERQKEFDAIPGAIEKAKVAVKEAEAGLPAAIKAAEAAQQAYETAMAATWQAMDALGMSGILGNDQLDGKLAQYMVIKTATPRGLAEFAGKSPENEKLIQQLFADKALMIQMLVADGPTSGKFGEAMKIYTDIQKASPKAKDGIFQRLAVAVSLAHSVPIAQDAPKVDVKAAESGAATQNVNRASEFVNPVKRYLSYEKWYLDGELHPGFKDLSVWNLTMVVDNTDPDEVYAWGRQMLRNLRPDCIPNDGDTSVYVDVVDKEIAYTSAMEKDDRPELQGMQNILANGGICGRRAFFGRFVLRAFGVPTTARKEPGHATLAYWHPDGWQTRLGGRWGGLGRARGPGMNSARSNPYGADLNFLFSSQAREDETAFMRVKRAQWIGEVAGETPVLGLTRSKEPGFWYHLSLQEQKRVIAVMKAKTAPTRITASVAAKAPVATGKVAVDDKGVITIPSAACSSPAERTHKLARGGDKDLVVFVKDNKAGETRLHLSRYSSEADSFEYTFDAPKGGKHQLVASVVTPKWDQRLFAAANGGTPVEMALPYTIGMWGKSAPVQIELKAGKNVLKFHGPVRVTVGKFTLTPAK